MLKILALIIAKIKVFYEETAKFVDRIEKHHVFLIAAGIAFNILLYLIPLFLVMLYLVDVIIGAETITSFLTIFAREILPPTDTTQEMLNSTLKEVNMILDKSSIAGWIGIISLIWLSSTFFSSIRSGLNRVFDIETPKIFFVYRIKDVLLTLILTVFMFLSTYILPIFSLVTSSLQQALEPPLDVIFSKISVFVFSLIVSVTFFFVIFRFIPNKKLPLFVVLGSTTLCVVSVEILRNIFAWYILQFGTYGKFYGTYAVIVSMAVWIYYLTLTILFSGELSRFFHEKLLEWKLRT